MTVTITPGKATGTIEAPPSKSYAHRMLLCAALAGEGAIVENVSDSDDLQATLACIRALGGEWIREENTIRITKGFSTDTDIVANGFPVCTHAEGNSFDKKPFYEVMCPCGESGSTLRFVLPLALVSVGGAVFTGSARLIERGISVYENVLAPKGICFEKFSSCAGTGRTDGIRIKPDTRITSSSKTGCQYSAPLSSTENDRIQTKCAAEEKKSEVIIASGRLVPGEYILNGDVSSQFVSGLLFALPLLEGDSTLTVLPPIESGSYISMTLETLRLAGVRIIMETESGSGSEPENRENNRDDISKKTEVMHFYIPGRQNYAVRTYHVEGDWSNAAFLYALNETGGMVKVTGLREDSLQGDRICSALFKKLSVSEREFEKFQEKIPEKVPKLASESAMETIDLSDCPDLGPLLFAIAARGYGGIFTGIRRLRLKECDRVQAMAEELAKFGVKTVIEENRVTVLPGKMHSPGQALYGHNDHRIVMALSLLCTEYGGSIRGAEAVSKSWPDFFEVLWILGLHACEESAVTL